MRLWNVAVMVVFLALLAAPASSAERWVELVPGGPRAVEVDVAESDLDGLVLDVTVPGFAVEDVLTKGGEFALLTLPPYGHAIVEGAPRIPVVRELVEVPQGAVPVVTATASFERLSLASLGIAARLVPSQAPVEKVPGALERAPFVLSEAAYSRDAFGPAEIAALGEIRDMRGHRFASLDVNPIRYNPVTGEIEVATSVRVEIRFEGADAAQTGRVLARYSNVYTEQVAGDLFINHDAFRSRYDIPLPIVYLIVVHDNFYDQILPLANWKDTKGFDCTIVRTSEIPGGNTRENIKAYIQNAYDTWPVPPTFVLLVGDTGYINYWVGTQTNNPPTDLYYVTMGGASDWVPDIWIGRFSCTSTAQVTNLVNKTLDYERYDLASGTAWIKKAVFMASNDNYTVTEGTHNYVISTYLDPLGYYSQKLYCHTYGATTQQVRDAFNDGRSLGIYSGHGDVTYWADGPVFTATDVNNLTNIDKLPLVHSYACLTGNFASACFGETWINATDKGALVFWGSSVTSYWNEDDYLERGAFKAAFNEGYTWAGGISHRGLYWLYQQYGGGGSTRRYFEMYNVLGDPAVDIWTNPPATLTVSYPGSIPVGTGVFDVNVSSGGNPVAKAIVCVEKEGDGVYEAAYTTSSGLAHLVLDPAPTTTGTMTVTVTKHNYDPFQGTASVSLASSPYCVYDTHAIDDDSSGGSSGNDDGLVDAGEIIELLVTLRNTGSQAATGVTATLSEGDAYVTVSDAAETYGDIPAGGTAQCLEDYDFAVSGSCPDGHGIAFTITATDGDTSWVSQLGLTVGAPVLVVDAFVADDSPGGGNGNGCAEAGETIGLSVTLRNTGSKAAAEVTAILSTVDPYVVVDSSAAGAASIASGGTATLTPEFSFTLDPATPANHEIEFSLDISTPLGYAATQSIAIMTGGGIDADFETSGTDWAHAVVTSGYVDQWHVETYRYHSAGHSWKFGGIGSAAYANSSDGALVTSQVCIGTEGELRFWDWLSAEEESSTSAWDCALVEISIDGGTTWVVVSPVGGYSHVKNSNTANPVPAGTPCWSGSHDWREEVFDLSVYEGENAVFRFRFASDGYVTQEGWYVDDVLVTSTTSGIGDEGVELLPEALALGQNRPNPFNPVTTISYAVPEAGRVTLAVYNVGGALVRTLVDADETPGIKTAVWDGRDDAGKSVASGVYYYRVTAGGRSERRAMVLLK